MNVLVTGASGFIGSRVLKAALAKGWSAMGISRRAAKSLFPADITDPNALEKLTNQGPFDAVVHCAGIAHRLGGVSNDEYERVNVLGTRHAASFAVKSGAKHFIQLSSVLVYGKHGLDITEAEDCHPVDPYAASKLKGEAQAVEIASRCGMALTILRPAPVIGEGCKGNFQRLVRAVDRGRFVNVGDGTARKSMVYVGDVANACVDLIESKNTRKTEFFNIAGETTTTGELIELVFRCLGKNGPAFSVPSRPVSALVNRIAATRFGPIRSVAKSLDTWLSDDVYSSEALREHYRYTATTSVSVAVERTVAAYIASLNN